MSQTPAKPGAVSIDAALHVQPNLPTATSRGRNWRGVTIDRYLPAGGTRLELPARDHHILFITGRTPGRLIQERAGLRHDSLLPPGSVLLMPSGYESRWVGDQPPNIRIRIPVALIEAAANEISDGKAASYELLNVFEGHDPFVINLGQILDAELDTSPHPSQSLIMSAGSMALMGHVLRQYNITGVSKLLHPSGLRKTALCRVLAYIEESIDRPIELGDLADLARVSRFHFSRLFKLSTGKSAMAFVENARLERAKALLKTTRHTTAEIAGMVGFADPAYFIRRFRRSVGCTPAQYARDNR